MKLTLIATMLLSINTSAQQERIFKFGSYGKIMLDVDQNDVIAALQVMAESFAEQINRKYKLNYKFENKFYTSFENLQNAIENNNVDCLSLPITDYFKLNRDSTIEPYFTGSSGGQPYVEYYVIINKDNRFNKLKDLQGTKLLLPTMNFGSLAGMWLFNTINKINKIESISDFFVSVNKTEFESKVILEVFFNKADAGVVSKSAYEVALSMNPQLTKKLSVIERSGKMITGLFALRKNLDEKTKELFENTAITMGDDENGKQILNLFKIDRLYRINFEMLNEARDIYNEYKLNTGSNN